MTTTIFLTQNTSLNTSASLNINPWQDTNLSPTLLQSDTKHICQNHGDNNYQHDISILRSNTDSTANQYNTQTINRQHHHNNRKCYETE